MSPMNRARTGRPIAFAGRRYIDKPSEQLLRPRTTRESQRNCNDAQWRHQFLMQSELA